MEAASVSPLLVFGTRKYFTVDVHLEKMQNAKKPIHRLYRLRLAHAVDTMAINVCKFIIVSLAGLLCSSGLY